MIQSICDELNWIDLECVFFYTRCESIARFRRNVRNYVYILGETVTHRQPL